MTTMTDATAVNSNETAKTLVHTCREWIAKLESISYDSLLATPARIFIAVTFWMSARTKVEGLLALSDSTFYLFQYEYQVPGLPYSAAAYIATYAEHLFPVLLIIGLASRVSAVALLTMTLVIQVFVYPNAWLTHLGWATALSFIIFRGPGALSIDALIRRRYFSS